MGFLTNWLGCLMSEEKKADSLLARQLAIPLYGDKKLFTGEARLAHADGMANIVRGIRDDEELISACYLFAVHDCVANPEEWLKNNFGTGVAELVNELHRLIELNGKTRLMPAEDDEKGSDKLMLKAQDALLRKTSPRSPSTSVRIHDDATGRGLRAPAPSVSRPRGVALSGETVWAVSSHGVVTWHGKPRSPFGLHA